MKKNEVPSLYIHIPFCNNICSYCDFCKVISNERLEKAYIEKLINDIDEWKENKFKTIFIGGGTPSCLPNNLLDLLLTKLDIFKNEVLEYTIEANPESIDQQFVETIVSHGINRVSMGVQTFNKDLLKLLNRNHDYNTVRKAVNLLKQYGINNISFDFIYGIPHETLTSLNNDLTTFASFDLPHISCYSLAIEQHTLLMNQGYKEPDEDTLREQYDMIYEFLYNHGYIRYEVSNFAKKGLESKHNLNYWENKNYVGLGAGASGYLNNIRYENTKSVQKYIDGVGKVKEEKLSPVDEEFYQIMLNLRTVHGIDLVQFNERFNCDFLIKYKEKVNHLEKYLEINSKFIKVKDEYLYILDAILLELLNFKE